MVCSSAARKPARDESNTIRSPIPNDSRSNSKTIRAPTRTDLPSNSNRVTLSFQREGGRVVSGTACESRMCLEGDEVERDLGADARAPELRRGERAHSIERLERPRRRRFGRRFGRRCAVRSRWRVKLTAVSRSHSRMGGPSNTRRRQRVWTAVVRACGGERGGLGARRATPTTSAIREVERRRTRRAPRA